MAGILDSLREFFTGEGARAANDRLQEISTRINSNAESLQNSFNTAMQQPTQDIESMRNVAGQMDTDYNNQSALNKGYQDQTALAQQQGRQFDAGTASSMGVNAEDFMRKAQEASGRLAEQGARTASMGAARQALQSARTGGMNKAQAAMVAQRQVGDTYSGNYQQGLQQGINNYQAGTQQFANQGTNLANRGMGYASLGQQGQNANVQTRLGQGQLYQGAGGLGIQRAGVAQQASSANTNAQIAAATGLSQNAQNAANAGAGVITGALNAAGQIVSTAITSTSDKNLKQDIKTSNNSLEELVAKVRPVNFKYNEASGEDTSKNRVGVLAQDLEKTSMADNVVETPNGKAVDVGQQTLSNTNLIIQLAQKVFELEAQLKARGN